MTIADILRDFWRKKKKTNEYKEIAISESAVRHVIFSHVRLNINTSRRFLCTSYFTFYKNDKVSLVSDVYSDTSPARGVV